MTRSLVLLAAVAPLARADGDPAAVSFEKDVLPVLKARCFSCHDHRKGTAELRLDVRSRAFGPGESKSVAIVPGKAADSEAYKRVILKDDDEKMMPPSGDRLTAEQIAKLKAWIDAGAKWPDALANEPKKEHWAFKAPVRPPVPGDGHPIDAFVRAKLAGTGLTPSPEAVKPTLVRRLSLDLVGLPPTPAEIDAFVNDPSPDAYKKLVAHLLASPHYGERWGRLWLDAARYADSDGYEKDKPRFVHFYRDWVVNALNRDLPYDRFVVEQLAGDLLPNPTQDQRVATGYLRNSMINEEGGIDPEQFRMEALFDRMDAVGKGVLGLTVQCAQCHTHKYDPITHAEYYRLFAFLNNAHEATATVYTPDEQRQRADLFAKLKMIDDDLKHRHPDWRDRLAAWEAGLPKPASWSVLKPQLDASGGEKHWVLPDGSVLCGGYAPTKSTEAYAGPTDLATITAARLECLTDPSLPRGGPGRSHFGLFALTEFKLEVVTTDGKATPVKVAAAYADAEAKERSLEKDFDDKSGKKKVVGPVAFAIDGKADTAWSPDVGWGRSNVGRQAVFVFAEPVAVPAGATVRVKLQLDHGGWNSDDNQTNNLGRFRLSLTGDKAVSLDPAAPVRAILDTPAEKRTPAQADALFRHWRTTVPEWKDANTAAEAEWAKHPAGASQLVLSERAEPRSTHVLKRGDFLKPAEAVSVGVPAFLHPLPKDAPPNRLGLAEWLVDRRSPTTARAIVNRVWQAYFGTGLVASPEDFGVQCEPPTHPELLDYLAVEFMESGWSLKKLHTLIVTSATYRQSSQVTPDGLAKDPANKLLARGPRFRVDAEVVRDIALKASGLLDERVGGPSVYPPVPKFLMLPPASYGPKVWPEAAGGDRYRRSLYVFSFRSVPYPPLAAFDAPPGEQACVRRGRSNTPIQALTALNEPVFVAAARALGLRALRDGTTDADRLRLAFRLTVGREPTAAERDILLSLLAKERAKFAQPDSDPWAVAFAGPDEYKRLPHTATPAEAAAWVAVARVLLNLDETLTKE